MCDKKFHVVLCPLAPDPGDATAIVDSFRLPRDNAQM